MRRIESIAVGLLWLLRGLLGRRVSVAGLGETALWLTLPYVVAGLAWAFLHPDSVDRMQTQLERQFNLPAGSVYEVAMIAEVTALWPVALLLPSDACAR